MSDALSDGRGRGGQRRVQPEDGCVFSARRPGTGMRLWRMSCLNMDRVQSEGMAAEPRCWVCWRRKTDGNDTNGIDQMISAYQKRYGGTYADAAGEMVNDALSGTFSEDGGVEQLVRWMSEDGGYTEQEKKNVLQTLADWLKKLVDSLREYIASVGHGTAGAEAGARLQNAEQLRAQVLAELDKAVETRHTGKKNAPASAEASDGGAMDSGDVRYSIQQDAEGTPFVQVDTDQHLFDGMSISEMQKKAQQIIRERFAGKVMAVEKIARTYRPLLQRNTLSQPIVA